MSETVHEPEQWRPVCGKYAGWKYEVSDHGRVRRSGGKMLKQLIQQSTGYPSVGMSNGKKSERVRIHSLVTEAFIGERPFKWCVNHKDGVKTNNNLSNLEYVTQRENVIHARDMGLTNYAVGEDIGCAVLTEELVRVIREEYERGDVTTRKLARKYGVGKSTVHAVTSRKTWNHVV